MYTNCCFFLDDSKEKRKICEQSGESEEKSIDCEEGRCGKCEVDFKPLEEDSTSHKEEGNKAIKILH